MSARGVVRWLKLAAGGVALALVVAALHAGVVHAGGTFGCLLSANLASGVNANALFYTEVGPVGEFIDSARGRYAGPPRTEPIAPRP